MPAIIITIVTRFMNLSATYFVCLFASSLLFALALSSAINFLFQCLYRFFFVVLELCDRLYVFSINA